MAKYIELEALKKRFAKRLVWLKRDVHDEYSVGLYDGCEYDVHLIDEIPAADVAPVVHGRWAPVHAIDPLSGYRCSNCRREPPCDRSGKEVLTVYCPSCRKGRQPISAHETDTPEALCVLHRRRDI